MHAVQGFGLSHSARKPCRDNMMKVTTIKPYNSSVTWLVSGVRVTVQKPAGLLQTPQTGQDEARDDIIGNQLTLIDARLHQETQICAGA